MRGSWLIEELSCLESGRLSICVVRMAMMYSVTMSRESWLGTHPLLGLGLQLAVRIQLKASQHNHSETAPFDYHFTDTTASTPASMQFAVNSLHRGL